MREPIDLAGEHLRGYVLAASDDFFAGRENLIKSEDPVPQTEQLDPFDQWIDGWQTRRRREPGNDWAIVRLGVPGVVEEVVIDTTNFTGDYPAEASLEGCVAPHNALPSEMTEWMELLPRSPLSGDKKNRFPVRDRHRFTHLRLNIFPDGGVARLKVMGHPVPNWMAPGYRWGQHMDLAALVNGGQVHSASDKHYGSHQNLILPGVEQGWETRRRRQPGNDWAVVHLAGSSKVKAVTLDTTHFHGNCPDKAQLEASSAHDPKPGDWFELLPPQTMIPHTEHHFQEEILPNSGIRWVRLNILPDGGMARLRIWGELDSVGYQQARLAFLNSCSVETLKAVFKEVCHCEKWALDMANSAPFFSLDDLQQKGLDHWRSCGEAEWLESLQGHPRIGDKSTKKGLSANWSRGEQNKAQSADEKTAAKLLEVQQEYFEKFGFIFLVFASGKSSAEILAQAEERIENSKEEELRNVAEQQAKITHLRLEKLLSQ